MLTGLVLGAGAAALLTLVLVLVLGGGAPRPAPPGLPDAGALVDWTLEVAPLLSTVLGALTVGSALLAGGFLGQTRSIPGVGTATRLLAATWAGLGLVTVAVTAVQVHALGPREPLLGELVGSVQVRATVGEAVLAASVALVVGRAPRLALPLAIAAVVPELLTGHVRTDDSPLVAGAALVVHVVAASLWVGGLFALTWLAVRRRTSWPDALGGYSRMALVCVLALAASGTVVALGRVHSLGDLFGSAYGLVIVVKALVLVALAAIGMLQRRHVVASELRGMRSFLLLAGSELTLMVLAFGLATGLSQTPPPPVSSSGGASSDPAAGPGRPVALPAALLTAADLPDGYRSGAGHHQDGAATAAPNDDPACAPIGELIGTHPSVLRTDLPQVSVSFTKSHFGPEVTETIIDYGDQASARSALTRFQRSGTRCGRHTQSTSPIGANIYTVHPGQPVKGAPGGRTVRLTAVGADFDGLNWDVWATRVGSRLVAVSLRSAVGGDNDDLAPAVSAALAKLERS